METQGGPQALRRGLVGLKSRVLLLRNPAREAGTIRMLWRGRATARLEGGPRASGGSTQSTAPLDVSILLSPQVRSSASPHGDRHPTWGGGGRGVVVLGYRRANASPHGARHPTLGQVRHPMAHVTQVRPSALRKWRRKTNLPLLLIRKDFENSGQDTKSLPLARSTARRTSTFHS